jgi:hypothetical protein
MMGTAGAMEITRVKPLENQLAKTSFESTPIVKDVESAGKRVFLIMKQPNSFNVNEKGINSYSEITFSEIKNPNLDVKKLQEAAGPDYEVTLYKSRDENDTSRQIVRIHKKTNKA